MITNAELISALVSDRQRYQNENPTIAAPDAIVVSGDLIQGVPLETADSEARLAEQYEAALDFLIQLADRFVDGDRSKVVIIPGNHDIDWVTSRSSMEIVPQNEIPENLAVELSRPNTKYRWDWRTRSLYRIANQTVYESRLDGYWRLFETFYLNVPRLLRVAPRSSANLYSLCDGRIGVAAFNSCEENDCFALHGSISRQVVSQTHLDLIDHQAYELMIAVWHHNIEGPPYRTDYMDVDIVRGMIGRGFRIGLYGHQHRAEAIPVQINLSGRETMAVISAGSLCAGSRELPTGAHRGYNIIEIRDDMQTARVHVREMSVANLFCPSQRAAFGGNSWIDMAWDPPADLAGRPINTAMRRQNEILEAAENELKNGHPDIAKGLLLPIKANLPAHGRLLLMEAARLTNDNTHLMSLLAHPHSIEELIEGIDILLRSRSFTEARNRLEEFSQGLGIAEPHLKELRSRIDATEAIAI